MNLIIQVSFAMQKANERSTFKYGASSYDLEIFPFTYREFSRETYNSSTLILP
jgi:hypothetical protein